MPDPCIAYLLLVGTTGTLSKPNDNVFPVSVLKQCKDNTAMTKVTFNDLQKWHVVYPMHENDSSYEYY